MSNDNRNEGDANNVVQAGEHHGNVVVNTTTNNIGDGQIHATGGQNITITR